MGRIPTGKRAFQADLQLDFTKGFALSARSDSEAELFQNIELNRDGSIMSRLGCFQHNTNDIGTEIVLGFGRQYFGANNLDTIVAAKTGTTYWYTSSPYFVAGPWQSFTSVYDGLYDPVVAEACTKLDETPILVMANINYPLLQYWDGAAGSATSITGSPPNCSLLRLSGARLYASGNAANPTRVYYSDNGDPTSWPSENFFDIPPNRGGISAMEVAAGTGVTLNIAVDRAWQSMFGDPAPGGGLSVQTVQDGIGTDTPRGVATLGSVTIFSWRGDLYSFSGSVQNMSEPYRGITMSAEFNTSFAAGQQPGGAIGNTNGIFADPVNNEMFITNTVNTIYVFARTAVTGAQPLRTIVGGSTALNSPEALYVDTVNNEIFVPNSGNNSVTVYARNANGNIAPIRTLSGAATFISQPFGVWVDTVNNNLLVCNNNNTLSVYGRTDSGNTAPTRRIIGGATGLNACFQAIYDTTNNEILVANSAGNSITVYSRTATGNASPIRTIVGGATGLDVPFGLNVDVINNEITVINNGNNSVTVYTRTASGNVAPLRTIAGGATGIDSAFDISVDTVNSEIFVANFNAQSVTVFNRTDDGNATPIRVLQNPTAVSAGQAQQAARLQSFAAITPYHIWFRPCTNTFVGFPPQSTNDLPSLLYCIDRERSGWFSIFLYDGGTTMGASNPWQAVVYPVDDYVMLSGGSGEIMFQPMRVLTQPDILGTLPTGSDPNWFARYTPDAPGIDVTATYRSRFREQGSPCAVKQARDLFITGNCNAGSCNVVLNVMDTAGAFQQFFSNGGQNGVADFTIPLDGVSNYLRIQTTISMQNMYLVSWTLSYRTRMVTGQFVL